MVSQLRRKYATGYKSLQKEWVKESKELLYVGRLAYWTYWVSKWAESSFKMKEVDELNALKKNAFKVLLKSAYSQLKKYCPRFSEKMRLYNEPVYILSIMDKKTGGNLLFEMYMPYLELKEDFPPLDTLENVSGFNGIEIISLDVGKRARKVETGVFSKKLIRHYFDKNYQTLCDYFAEKSPSSLHRIHK